MTDDGETTRSDRPSSERIVLTATEARAGEIVLGRRGRWIWAGSFVLMVLLVVALALWW
jgi:hypothetical protein